MIVRYGASISCLKIKRAIDTMNYYMTMQRSEANNPLQCHCVLEMRNARSMCGFVKQPRGRQCTNSPKVIINTWESLLCCATPEVKRQFSYWLINSCQRGRCIRFRFLINRDDKSPEEQFFSLHCFMVFRVNHTAKESPRWGCFTNI